MYPQYGAPPEPAGILLVEHVGIWEITKKKVFQKSVGKQAEKKYKAKER